MPAKSKTPLGQKRERASGISRPSNIVPPTQVAIATNTIAP